MTIVQIEMKTMRTTKVVFDSQAGGGKYLTIVELGTIVRIAIQAFLTILARELGRRPRGHGWQGRLDSLIHRIGRRALRRLVRSGHLAEVVVHERHDALSRGQRPVARALVHVEDETLRTLERVNARLTSRADLADVESAAVVFVAVDGVLFAVASRVHWCRRRRRRRRRLWRGRRGCGL